MFRYELSEEENMALDEVLGAIGVNPATGDWCDFFADGTDTDGIQPDIEGHKLVYFMAGQEMLDGLMRDNRGNKIRVRMIEDVGMMAVLLHYIGKWPDRQIVDEALAQFIHALVGVLASETGRDFDEIIHEHIC